MSPLIIAKVSPECNPRQAIQLLTKGIKPVGPEIEKLLEIPGYLDPDDLETTKRVLFAGLMSGEISLSGCPVSRDFREESINGKLSLTFGHLDERREISASEIVEAGIDGFDLEGGGHLYRFTEESPYAGMPRPGWEYVNLLMPTKQLESFRSHIGVENGTLPPAPIDLTKLRQMRSGELANSQHVNSADSLSDVAETELFSLSRYGVAPARRDGGNGRTDVSNHELPLHLQYLEWIFVKLGPEDISSLKKDILVEAIKKHWWCELGPYSRVLGGYMATILRPPGARLGAKPRTKRRSRP